MTRQLRNLSLIVILFWASIAFTYQANSLYQITLNSGKVIRGVLLSENRELIVVRDQTGVRLTIRKKNIDSLLVGEPGKGKTAESSNEKQPSPVKMGNTVSARTYQLEDLKKIPQLSLSIKEEEQPAGEEIEEQSQSYGGKGEKFWVMQVLRIGLSTREAEKDYSRLYQECHARNPANPNAPQRNEPACQKANQTLAALRNHLRQYELFLDGARRAAVPLEWLKAHYQWARWGSQWADTQEDMARSVR